VSEPIPEPTGTEYYTGKPRKMEHDRHDPRWWDEDDQLAPDETPESKPAFNGEAHQVGSRVRCSDPIMDSAFGPGTVMWNCPGEDSYDVLFDTGSGGMFHGRMLVQSEKTVRWFYGSIPK
jgi:hypothetical protein